MLLLLLIWYVICSFSDKWGSHCTCPKVMGKWITGMLFYIFPVLKMIGIVRNLMFIWMLNTLILYTICNIVNKWKINLKHSIINGLMHFWLHLGTDTLSYMYYYNKSPQLSFKLFCSSSKNVHFLSIKYIKYGRTFYLRTLFQIM